MGLDQNRLLKPAKKLRKLIDRMSAHPAPDKVHDLRTNTRRFEAIFEALSLNCRNIGKHTLKDLSRCRKRAGKVRDMDVLTGYASAVHPQGEEDCGIELLEHLAAQRRKHAKRLYSEVKKLRPTLQKELKRTPAVLSKEMKQNGDASANAAATAVRLAAQLADPDRLTRANLHPYRLKVKELQNVLRLASGDSPKLLADLGAVKDAIGEWHDWVELAGIGQKAVHHGRQCALLAELKRTAGQKYQHALSLAHALRRKYLRSSHSPHSSKIPNEPVWAAIAMLA